jgi:hypothetical protein
MISSLHRLFNVSMSMVTTAFNIPVATLYRVYISLYWHDIPELVVPTMVSLVDGCC